VVSHHLGGFLQLRGSRLVASWFRKGFAAFHSRHRPPNPKIPWTDDPVRATHAPFEESSLVQQLAAHHCAARALLPFLPNPVDMGRIPPLRAEREPTDRHRRSDACHSIRQTRPGTSPNRISSVQLGETALGTLPA
jgi:hypothetical protein